MRGHTACLQQIIPHRLHPPPPRAHGDPLSCLDPQTMGHILSRRTGYEALHRFPTHSPIPSIRVHIIPLQDILLESTPLDSWRWAGPECSLLLGNLRATLSHQRVLANRTNRDLIGSGRGASPTWLNSHQSIGAASWSYRSQPLRKRVQALRTLWDLRCYGENKAVATQSHDPQVSACPICHRL